LTDAHEAGAFDAPALIIVVQLNLRYFVRIIKKQEGRMGSSVVKAICGMVVLVLCVFSGPCDSFAASL
jgi:hypothetical protein